MKFQTVSSPHKLPERGIGGVMRQVLYALIPGTIAYAWYFGWSILITIALSIFFAVILEAAVLALRKKDIRLHLSDYSAVVTAWLFALTLPSLSPWWLILVGICFAILIGKHIYGGLGYNPFNPAMVGYVVLLISFPQEMTRWLLPISISEISLSFFDSVGVIFSGLLPGSMSWDSITQATPLDSLKTGIGLNASISDINQSPIFGHIGGTGWESISIFWLLGGLWLLFQRVITWRIPAAMLITVAALSLFFHLINPEAYASPGLNILSGGVLLAAFFIATDPVSASTTPRGQLVFGAGVGAITYIIRTWGGYPDGVAFAVLLMNMTAPTIDYYTKTRVYGSK
ncbi:MAG: electron transport complex subunit RsxD [Gammaproteobacteria bacterium]|nr:electron transport complex subunit RsxD [Gammaproteobacteria bacterium]